MHGPVRLLVVPEGAQSGRDHVLQVRLARVDDVVDARAVAELLTGGGLLAGGDPQDASVRIAHQWTVVEILAEQAELPELVGDVLADVGHRAVGTHDDLAFFGKAGHDPAAGVLAFAFRSGWPCAPSAVSKAAAQNWRCRISLSRGRTSYSTSEAQHGGEVRLDDGVGHQVGQLGEVAFAGLDGVQRGFAPLERFGMVLVIGGNARVEVPAVIVEANGGIVQEFAAPRRRSSPRGSGSPPRRRPPARPCCRCNSAPRRGGRRRAACGRKCRPGRRCAGGRCARPCWD